MAVPTIVWTALVVLATVPYQKENPTALVATAREVIGGEARLSTVRSLVLTGHTQNLIGSTGKLSEPRPVDIRILLPDRYLRVQTESFYELRSGFAGDRLLNSARALKPGDQFGATYGPEQIGIERATFVRLMLGMLAQTTTVLPLTTHPAGNNSVRFAGPDGFAAMLELDAAGLPNRLRFQSRVHFPQPGSTMPPPPVDAEVVWTFGERREVNGLKLPHRILRTSRDVTLEDLRFDTIRVNPPLSAKDFDK